MHDLHDACELTARWTNPGTKPTFAHRQITHRRLEIA
jgi:hypothetical protein